MIAYHIGVDGGGSGTRVRLEQAGGQLLAQAQGGPSGLAHGVGRAWDTINSLVAQAFGEAGLAQPPLAQLALGLGLAGVHNQQWADSFVGHDPGYGALALASDALTTLLGAHGGRPGAIIAIGTGSVGEVLQTDGTRREVGGWGFPSGDEAGGAWMGMRAIAHAQQVMDGRLAGGAFAAAVIKACGGQRHAVQDWLAAATQTTYATLAPLVLQHAGSDAAARAIAQEAGRQIALMASALDPADTLPLALCGGLAAPLSPYLPAELLQRVLPAQGDSASGALHLLRQQLSLQKENT